MQMFPGHNSTGRPDQKRHLSAGRFLPKSISTPCASCQHEKTQMDLVNARVVSCGCLFETVKVNRRARATVRDHRGRKRLPPSGKAASTVPLNKAFRRCLEFPIQQCGRATRLDAVSLQQASITKPGATPNRTMDTRFPAQTESNSSGLPAIEDQQWLIGNAPRRKELAWPHW